MNEHNYVTSYTISIWLPFLTRISQHCSFIRSVHLRKLLTQVIWFCIASYKHCIQHMAIFSTNSEWKLFNIRVAWGVLGTSFYKGFHVILINMCIPVAVDDLLYYIRMFLVIWVYFDVFGHSLLPFTGFDLE